MENINRLNIKVERHLHIYFESVNCLAASKAMDQTEKYYQQWMREQKKTAWDFLHQNASMRQIVTVDNLW